MKKLSWSSRILSCFDKPDGATLSLVGFCTILMAAIATLIVQAGRGDVPGVLAQVAILITVVWEMRR